MKFTSSVLLISFLVGASVAKEAASGYEMEASRLFKRAPLTEQEKADLKAAKDAEKAQRDAEREVARSERKASKAAKAAAASNEVIALYIDHPASCRSTC